MPAPVIYEGRKIMSDIPKDPNILYSYINMQLRDGYDSLQDLCNAKNIPIEQVTDILEAAGYSYNESVNQFR